MITLIATGVIFGLISIIVRQGIIAAGWGVNIAQAVCLLMGIVAGSAVLFYLSSCIAIFLFSLGTSFGAVLGLFATGNIGCCR